jgi:protoporphyrinogen oxidase
MSKKIIIVGGGFTGLAAALKLQERGFDVTVLEADDTVGGLAGTFQFQDGVVLEKFYHHWFNNDEYIPMLAQALELEDQIETHSSETGMYFNNRIWRLSSPLDLLRFTPLSLLQRIRLGLLVFQVRLVKDWKSIEHLTIRDWLVGLCGEEVYRVVWEPLVNSKFSNYSDRVNAVWMWKKLVLRGSTRNQKGAEELAYFKGGFGRMAEAVVKKIEKGGGSVITGCKVVSADTRSDSLVSLQTDKLGAVQGDAFLFTPSLSLVAQIMNEAGPLEWIESLRRVNYLGNICITLRLDRSLSGTYWLNVNDPGFPFVGVIEHTNFDSPENYGNSHIVYLSRYLSTEDPLWGISDEQYEAYCIDHLKMMFPDFDSLWVLDSKIWRAEYAQPVTELGYSEYLPGHATPFKNAWIYSMAQIYPEDRGTNYAIREGYSAADVIAEST